MSKQHTIDSLTHQKEALNETIARMKHQLENTPQIIRDDVARELYDAQKDVEFHERALAEAQLKRQRLLSLHGISGFDIKLALPTKTQQ